jgi:4-amino-4-deoxy-L-arabinose transferase-like glycosyltransferase
VLGVSIASTQLVRIAALALTFSVIYRLGARFTAHASAPFVLLASYVYFPIISWEGTHYQSHTVLLSLMTVAAFLVVMEIRRAPSVGKFALLGLVCGLGVLSKYTFVAILGSLFVAGLAAKEYRVALFRPAAFVAAGVMFLVAAPPVIDVFLRLDGIANLPAITQEVRGQDAPLVGRSLVGAARLFEQYALQSLLFVAMVATVWGTALPRADLRRAFSNPDFRFFAIQAAASLGITLAVVLAFGLDGISAHHPVPLLLSLPIVVVLAADSSGVLEGASKWRARFFVGGAVLAVAAIWAILLWSLLSVFPRYFPSYEPVAAASRASGGPHAVIIAERYRIGGPLRVHEPAFEVYAADLANRLPAPSDEPRAGGCVAVWWERGEASPPPGDLVAYVERIIGRRWPNPGTNSAVVANSTDGRADPAVSRLEPLPAGGICAVPHEAPASPG